jgi:hypothetical protein
MIKLTIKPWKQNKKMMQFFKADPKVHFEQILREGLEVMIKHLQNKGKRSIVDYEKLQLVKIQDGYALVFPEERKALNYLDRHTILVEFPSTHALGGLGLIPPEVLTKELRKEKLISRRVRREEYERVIEEWMAHPSALIEAGLLVKGATPAQRRSQLTGLAPEAYAEIQAVENLSWTVLREEYGIQEKRLTLWRKELVGLEQYVEDHLEEVLTQMQKGRKAQQAFVPMEEIEQEELEFFSRGLDGTIKPGKTPPRER